MEDVLKGLNEEQKQAVLHTEGPLLVIAGAGSGKTKVITHRIAHLISKGVAPENILAITFTNKAAEEMKERIKKILMASADKTRIPFISTFHSLGVYILRESGDKIGISRRFSIIDEDDALKIIKEILKDLNLKQETFNPSKVRSFISGQKNKFVSYTDFSENAEDYFPKIMSEIWYRYEEKLKEQSMLDFDDLIIKTIDLLKGSEEARSKYQNKWLYAHIDEYQDTNKPQYILSRLLAEKHKNICVVGDHDQAIYSFRGADFTNILNFNKDWEAAKVITLNKNYRSTKNILDTANLLISFNKARHPKDLSSSKEIGDAPLLFTAGNEIEEGEFAAKAAKSILDSAKLNKENPLPKIAVLLRTNFQSRIFEEFFMQYDVPYEMLGTRFFERKEIKDILSYIKFALNRNDFLSFGRMASTPVRGLGEKTLLKYFKKELGILDKKQKEIDNLLRISDKILEAANSLEPAEVIKAALAESGYETYLMSLGEEGEKRMENIRELVSLAKKYSGYSAPEGVFKMLEESALMSDQDRFKFNENSVKIITAHAAKGLEFDAVFIAGLEEGLFPYHSYTDTDKEMKIEEERRLFYVALTRARKNLFLSYAKSRMVFGERKINKPSRFLTEIKDKVMKI